MLRPYQRTVTIHDASGNITSINLEVTYHNGYPEFTMSNEHGQWQDRISPKGDNQKKLLRIWHEYRLNGMHAGTPEQEEALKDRYGVWFTYEQNIEYLKLIGLYATEHEGRTYQYGSGWIRKDLPKNFIDTLEALCDNLDIEEDEHNANPITESMIDEEFFIEKAKELDITPEKLMAICLHCTITVEGIEHINNEQANNFCIEGQDYLVWTESEVNKAHLEYIENLVDECGIKVFSSVGKPTVTQDFDWSITVNAWEVYITASERGNSLASYDGNENEVRVNGETFYLYRR